MIVQKYPVEQLRPFIEDVFRSTGVPHDHTITVTDSLLEANLRGIDSHGIRLIPVYVKRLDKHGVNPKPEIRVISDTGATLRLHGDNGLGQIVGIHAMKCAIDKAEQYGIGFAVAGKTNHIGAASYYTRFAVKHDMAGFCTSNNLPSMFVYGGLKRALSNPPFSISFPSRKTPFVLDICLGTVAWNKIYMKLQQGESIPPGWARDSKGKVTIDPRAASEGGSIIPIGEHKGSGMAIAVELFTGVLSGLTLGSQVKALFGNETESEECSCLMMAFNIKKILGLEALEGAEAFIAWCKDSPLAEGFDAILMPGEPEEKVRKRRLGSGIPILSEDIDRLKEIAEDKKIDHPFGN
jgi:LDH2 family malate/lactate/ureidoglycolate dehydrogenase